MHRAFMILAALAVTLGLAACGGESSADGGDFCGLAESFSDYEDTASELFADGGAADSAKFEEAWTMVTTDLGRFRDAAPSEIEGDVGTVTAVVDEFTEILEDVNYDLTALIAKAATDPSVGERLESFDNVDVEAASERVEEYVRDECGSGHRLTDGPRPAGAGRGLRPGCRRAGRRGGSPERSRHPAGCSRG